MTADPQPLLIVEDDLTTQMLLKTLFGRYGYTCDIAANGAEAISLLGSRSYSAVVLDLMMPTVGGRDVVDHISAAGKNTPVIVCTAAGPTVTTNFDPRVVKAVVRKPFDIEHLVGLVRQVTAGK